MSNFYTDPTPSGGYMNRSELNAALKLIKRIDAVFVHVTITDDDGLYVEVSKAAFKRSLPPTRGDESLYRAILRDDGDLYIA